MCVRAPWRVHFRRWRLAPCYDLTFCEGPGGEHQMDVCGEGREISRASMLALARQGGLNARRAVSALDRILECAGRFRQLATSRAIRRASVKHVETAIEANRLRLAT